MIETIMIGNIGADAVVRRNNGQSFVSFSVAHTDKYKQRDGQMVEDTMWVSVAVDGDGGNLTPYLTKGKVVCIRGRLKAKADGKGGVYYNMSNPRIDLISNGGGNNNANAGQQAQGTQQAYNAPYDDPFGGNNNGNAPY